MTGVPGSFSNFLGRVQDRIARDAYGRNSDIGLGFRKKFDKTSKLGTNIVGVARWWLFDGTHQANLDGIIRIGVGRDTVEIAFASPFGDLKEGPVTITIDRADGSVKALGRTIDAISTEEPAPHAGAN